MEDNRYLEVKCEVLSEFDSTTIEVEQSCNIHELTPKELTVIIVRLIKHIAEQTPLPEKFIMDVVTKLWKEF